MLKRLSFVYIIEVNHEHKIYYFIDRDYTYKGLDTKTIEIHGERIYLFDDGCKPWEGHLDRYNQVFKDNLDKLFDYELQTIT
jgi:hypothetical protein